MYRFPKKQQLMNDNEDEDCIDDDDEDVDQGGDADTWDGWKVAGEKDETQKGDQRIFLR